MDMIWGSGEPPQYPPLPPQPPILEAAAQCNAKMVMRLLDENPALINFSLPEYEQQPLHEAAHWGCNKVVELLLDRGAEINALDRRRMTPLHHAAETAETKVVKTLLKRGADPSLLDVFGFTPLVTAARRLDKRGYRTARAMIREGVKYDLHAAICLGDVATVRSLLDADPDLPLRYAVPGDLLFDAMMMVDTRTEDYEVSPNMLDESIRDFGPICKLLVSHGVSPNASSVAVRKNPSGTNPEA